MRLLTDITNDKTESDRLEAIDAFTTAGYKQNLIMFGTMLELFKKGHITEEAYSLLGEMLGDTGRAFISVRSQFFSPAEMDAWHELMNGYADRLDNKLEPKELEVGDAPVN
ncbi:MAG: hypothetical protein ACRC29_13910 [Enterobacterales bacterium]